MQHIIRENAGLCFAMPPEALNSGAIQRSPDNPRNWFEEGKFATLIVAELVDRSVFEQAVLMQRANKLAGTMRELRDLVDNPQRALRIDVDRSVRYATFLQRWHMAATRLGIQVSVVTETYDDDRKPLTAVVAMRKP